MHELDRCIIYGKNGGRVAEGYVHRFGGGAVQICPQGDSAFLDLKGPVVIFIYNRFMGECKYAAEISRVSPRCIEATGVHLISAVQKRESTRVNKRLYYRIDRWFEGDAERKFDCPVDIAILNISATGMYFSCDRRFERGFSFPMVLRETARPVALRVEVVRREDDAGGFHYGCRFVGISREDVNEIFRFVFREQLRQRRMSRLI